MAPKKTYRGYEIERETVTIVDGSEKSVGLIAYPQFRNPVPYKANGHEDRRGVFTFNPVQEGGRKKPLQKLLEAIERRIDEQHAAFKKKAGYEVNPETLNEQNHG